MNRELLIEYIKKQYGTEPEYPWKSSPNFAVFRHRNNKKWYGLIADVPKIKLGLEGHEIVDILNIKCDPDLVYILRQQNGILPAYHMNKEHWLTILLDDSVPQTTITELLHSSYNLTQSKCVTDDSV